MRVMKIMQGAQARSVNNSAPSKNQGMALDKARFSEVLPRVLQHGRRKIVTLHRIQTDFYK
jgi:hypothetical protein